MTIQATVPTTAAITTVFAIASSTSASIREGSLSRLPTGAPHRAHGTPSCRRDGAMLQSWSAPAACSSTVLMISGSLPRHRSCPPFGGFVANGATRAAQVVVARSDQECAKAQSSERCPCARQTTVSAAP